MHSNEIENHSDPIPTSEVCLHCGEPTLNGARWCDADCRNDHVEEPARVGW